MTTKNMICEDKIAIISDAHLGVHSDSEVWHKIILDYATWLKSELSKKSIKDIFILGDFFNNREEVGVNTLNVAEKFFNILNEFNITILIGNHDCYLRDSSEINSISVFKGWKNINVVDKVETITVLDKTITLCPWGYNLENLPRRTNVLMGHFEINNFKKTISKLCENGVDSETLLERADLVLSGHFHLRDERDYNGKKIIYVGCPYQQTWNDTNSTKGYYILDLKDISYEFFENTISPKFHKIKLSSIFDKENPVDLKQLLPNNYIKIVVDMKIEFEKFEKLINKLTMLKPLEISSEFNEREEVVKDDNCEIVSLDVKNIISEYIDTLEVKELKESVVKEIEMIYNSALNKLKIEVV